MFFRDKLVDYDVKYLKTPDSKEFLKLVESYENSYEISERVYRDALKKFEIVELHNLNENHVDHILKPYFLKWGKMARVLGFNGCEMIGSNLMTMGTQLEKFRQEDLSTIDLINVTSEIVDVYEEIMNIKFKSKKGNDKRVGPTSASKVLHLVAPNMFIIWDRAIRNYYGFKETGEEYARFLLNTQNWMKELKPTIERLQHQYERSCVKIVDEYNWIKCRTSFSHL